MEPYAPYRQVFFTWTRPRTRYSLGTSARPSRMLLGQPWADEGGCYTSEPRSAPGPAPPQPLAEEGKEEVPEKEEGEEEVPEEEEGKEEVPVPEEEEGEEEVPKEESLELVPEPEEVPAG